MPHPGRAPHAPIRRLPLVTGLMLATVVLFHGTAVAQQVARPGQRGTRRSAISHPVDPAAQRARQLLRSIKWEEGPETVGLGGIAEIKVSPGYRFTAAAGSATLLEVCRIPAPKHLLGVLAPSGSFDWFVIFESKPALQGDGIGKTDASAMLRQLREENEADNAVRRAHGWAECKNLEWERPPSSNERTQGLSWATRSVISGHRDISSVTRLYGGSGAIDAHLVAKADDVAQFEPTVENILTLVEFADDPNFGARRNEQATPSASAPTSSSYRSTPVVYSTGYRAGGGVSFPRSRGFVGGFITAFCTAIGAAFRKKKSSSA